MTPEILLIVPTRGRPAAVAEFLDAWRASTDGRSKVVFAVDADDPTGDATTSLSIPDEPVWTWSGPRMSMCGWTNWVAAWAVRYDATKVIPRLPSVLCSLGDDHRLEGPWEQQVLDAVAEAGGTAIVYGDDGIQGERLPTCCFVTANIVAALGYMVPPGIEHLYADNFWREIGVRAGVLRYLPGLSTPHLHPAGGTVPWDDTYAAANSPEADVRDRAAFERWLAEDSDRDVAIVRALRGATLPQDGPGPVRGTGIRRGDRPIAVEAILAAAVVPFPVGRRLPSWSAPHGQQPKTSPTAVTPHSTPTRSRRTCSSRPRS